MHSIHLCGLGGQGILTLSHIIARCSENLGHKAVLFHSRGMAQRGGRVSSDIRISRDPKREFGARIPEGGADIVVGMELGEAANSLPYLKPGGIALLHSYTAVPTSVVLDRKRSYTDADEVSRLYHSKSSSVFLVERIHHSANVYILGVLTAFSVHTERSPGFGRDNMEKALQERISRSVESNRKAFFKGYLYGEKLLAEPGPSS